MIAVGVVLALLGSAGAVVSAMVGGRQVDGSSSEVWSRRWWRALGLQAAGQGLFVGGVIFWGQELGLLQGVAVGVLVLGVVIAAFFLMVWSLRSWRRRRAGSPR